YENRIDELIDFLNENSKRLNLKYVLTHPPEDPSSTHESLISRLERINVPILIENIKGQTDEDFMAFYFKAKERLGEKLKGHALDAPHRYVTDNNNWLNIPKELVDEIEYIHISDCSKTADLHLPLGMAELPYNEFFDFLKEIGYQGVILQEIIPNAEQILFVFDSFLYNIKPFSRKRYRRLKILYALIRPFVQLMINTTYKQLRKDKHGILIKDLGYELGFQS
ncbi:MAG: TIM barrel protein, partial [Candidatus Heimdallarchaeota archaeon]